MIAFAFSILKAVIVALIVKFILYPNKKKWLEEHPVVKYKIDLFFYTFHKYIYSQFFSIGFAIYGIVVSLFDPNYNTLPKFTAAWISFGLGLFGTILFRYINKGYKRPVRP